MDFSQVVGKEVLWTGEFENDETLLNDTYILFSDGSVAHFPHRDSVDAEPRILEHGLDVLREELNAVKDNAANIWKLVSLFSQGFADKAPSEGPPAPPSKEYLDAYKAIVDKKLPAHEEIMAIMALDEKEAEDIVVAAKIRGDLEHQPIVVTEGGLVSVPVKEEIVAPETQS